MSRAFIVLVGGFAGLCFAGDAVSPPADASVLRAARRLLLENAVCAADLDRALAAERKGRPGRLDGTTMYYRRESQEKAQAGFRRAQRALRREFPESFDLARCGTAVQAARVMSRKPIPSPDTADDAREWASVMPEPTVAALLCLRRRAPASPSADEAARAAAVLSALEAAYAARFGPFTAVLPQRCGAP